MLPIAEFGSPKKKKGKQSPKAIAEQYTGKVCGSSSRSFSRERELRK